jgi:hypothetical protein
VLSELISKYQGPAFDKWESYLPFYERILSPYLQRPVKLLELGIGQGGSLRIWSQLFPQAKLILGVDKLDSRVSLADDHISIHIGDVSKREVLIEINEIYGPFDIVIDDASHKFSDQILAFEQLFPKLSPDGLFVVEDIHTSYYSRFGGGVGTTGTFVEFTKDLIDRMHHYRFEPASPNPPDPIVSVLDHMCLGESIVAFFRGTMTKPRRLVKGIRSFEKPK